MEEDFGHCLIVAIIGLINLLKAPPSCIDQLCIRNRRQLRKVVADSFGHFYDLLRPFGDICIVGVAVELAVACVILTFLLELILNQLPTSRIPLFGISGKLGHFSQVMQNFTEI